MDSACEQDCREAACLSEEKPETAAQAKRSPGRQVYTLLGVYDLLAP